MASTPAGVLRELYADFLQQGIRYFFPNCRLDAIGESPADGWDLVVHDAAGGLDLDWFGTRYHLACNLATVHQHRLLAAIGSALSARYRSIFEPAAVPTSQLFHGLPEDRYVSAFLDQAPGSAGGDPFAGQDVIADAIQVLRQSSLLTYENRRITTGALLLGSGEDACHPRLSTPTGSLRYNSELVVIKSFNRLCDGLNSLLLVNHDGLLVDVVDVHHWCSAFAANLSTAAPAAARYRAHAAATLAGGHICLVLTPNGEIKIFAEGSQVFNFLGGRWRLTDSAVKYAAWREAIGDAELAELLFVVARNMAENRRGGLFVVLDDATAAGELLAPGDLASETGPGKGQIHYLLRGKRVLDMEPAVLESIGRVDGAVVLDRYTNLLAFGAILRHAEWSGVPVLEGGRTTAAAHASCYGNVLKISEDGFVSFYRAGACVWDI